MRKITIAALFALILPAHLFAAAPDWAFGLYADVGYLASDNQPENNTWRSKGTTSQLDRIEANMLRAYGRKEATESSRWGIEFGFQYGIDADGLIPAPPPPAEEPVGSAEDLIHLSTSTASYLFDMGNGLAVTGGLLGAYIGYESYFSKDNPNYTRGYLADYVPYYLWGIQASYPLSDRLTGDFIVMTGYNYLANPNNNPSFGIQLTWQALKPVTVTQNLYYGPDQSDTSLEYWRFFSDTIIEWKRDRLTLAGALDFGTEKQAWLPCTPYHGWMSGALWGRLDVNTSWRVGLRPEFYHDPNGLMTGARQTIWAVTATVEYHTGFLSINDLSARAEYRFDRSTGDDGGFYKGADNMLVPNQNLFIASLVWAFDWTHGN
jgi:hypothetical protein